MKELNLIANSDETRTAIRSLFLRFRFRFKFSCTSILAHIHIQTGRGGLCGDELQHLKVQQTFNEIV